MVVLEGVYVLPFTRAPGEGGEGGEGWEGVGRSLESGV